MHIDIEQVFTLHVDGSEVQPGEEPRAKREWLDSINRESRFAKVEELDLSTNGNYQFRITSNDKYTISMLLNKWYLNGDSAMVDGYMRDCLIE